jgi:EF-P beta-lysylation protein EpmB
MREAITHPEALLEVLGLKASDLGLPLAALRNFPMRVPRSYVARMQYQNPNDPLLLQVFPRVAEDLRSAGFVADPVGDLESVAANGLLHKYPGRALLITTGACAVHCRYCFRREFPYTEQNARASEWQAALDVIRNDHSIEEVILSGGDPLSLSDEKLLALSEQLDAIPHLKRLRIHSRQPIVLPERVNAELLAWLGHGRLQRIMVLHCNHAQELDEPTRKAIAAIHASGVMLFNQAVLLRDINNSLQSQTELCLQLVAAKVVPYYLHQLDRVRGAAHFEVSDIEALRLHKKLQDTLPGYMVPRLVREVAGDMSKRPLRDMTGI